MPDDATPPRERLLFLLRARSRLRVVEHLAANGPATQRALRTELDAARTTVARATTALEDTGWIERVDGAYRLTRAGRTLTEDVLELLDTVDRVDELEEFLRWLPAGVDAPDFHEADDVQVTYSTPAAPYAPARTQTEILYSADRLRALLPAIELDSTETLHEQVTERGLTVEAVVSPDVEATMESAEFAPLMREKGRTGRSTVFVAAEPCPFYLGLADDDRTQVGLADDDGLPRALLETTDDAVRAWGERVYRRYREDARRKPASEF